MMSNIIHKIERGEKDVRVDCKNHTKLVQNLYFKICEEMNRKKND